VSASTDPGDQATGQENYQLISEVRQISAPHRDNQHCHSRNEQAQVTDAGLEGTVCQITLEMGAGAIGAASGPAPTTRPAR